MSDLRGFFADCAELVEPIEYAPTTRYKDENGNPRMWKLVPVTTEREAHIRKECRSRIQANKRGEAGIDFDSELYTLKMNLAAVVFPDLNNSDLQDSYGVKTAGDLLQKILGVAGEYTNLSRKVEEISSPVATLDDEIQAVKN